MSLTRLVYYSLRNPGMNLDIHKLIETANRNNRAKNVTGILHYNQNAFLQVLEGHRAEVNLIYHSIAADPRHMNLMLIECAEAKERLFPFWSMALHEGMDEKSSCIFLRYFGNTFVNPDTVNSADLVEALQELSADTKQSSPVAANCREVTAV